MLEYVSPYSRVNYSSFELAKMQFVHDIKNDVGCDIDMSILLAINAFAGKSWDKYILDRGFSYDDFPPVWAGSTEAINNYIGVEKQTTKKIYEKIYFHMGGMSMYNMIPKLFLLVWLVVLFVNLLSLCLNLLL